MPRRVISVTPVITAVAYAAGDAVGGLMEFAMATGYAGKSGVIESVEIIDRGGVGAGLTLQLFDRTFTPTADNAAYAPSDADIPNAIGNVAFVAADYAGGSTNKVATKVVNVPFQLPSSGTSLFGQLFTQGAPLYAVGDLTVKITISEGDI